MTPQANGISTRVPGRAFGAAVTLALASYFFLATSAQSVLYDGLSLAATGAMFVGIALSHPRPRFAWVLLASGTGLLAVGDVVYGVSQPVPSAADMFYVSAYPILGLGFFGLIRRRARPVTRSVWVEAGLLAAGIGIITIVLMLVPATGLTRARLVATFISLSYPLMDLVLAGLLVRAGRTDDELKAPILLLGAGVALRLVADAGFALLDFGTSYALGNPLDIAWLLSYACFGAALLHPSIRRKTPPRPFGRVPHLSRTEGRRPVRASAQTYQSQALRLPVILSATGRILLLLGLVAVLLSATWMSPSLMLVAGAYAGTGLIVLAASRVRA